MLHKSFGEFIDKKKRDATKQLEVVEGILRSSGLKVENFLESTKDPYIFCFNPLKNSSFDGIRIYKIGDQLAFRVQKENKTHPYGRAYPLDVEEMYNDLLSDDGIKETEAGKKVIEAVSKEVRRFFELSAEAEKDGRRSDIEDKGNSVGNVSLKPNVMDFGSASFNSKGT